MANSNNLLDDRWSKWTNLKPRRFFHSNRRENPLEEYKDLSGKFVCYAAGLPLTVNVLGSFLCGEDKDEWIDEEIEDILANDLGTEATRHLRLKRGNSTIVMNGLRKMKKLKYLEVYFTEALISVKSH
nr:Toll/interleukin-1 receptor (TIR) domain-containing protein [Tanacetum cinerariifolium]